MSKPVDSQPGSGVKVPGSRSKLVGEAIFGSFDGLMTAIGVLLGAAHATTRLILEIALCVAVTGALSMGAGTILEDDHNGWREGGVMGTATLLGTFLPAVPILLFSRPVAYVVTTVVSLTLAGVIAKVRGGTRRDFATSFGMLFLVALPTVAISLALGAPAS